MSPYNTERRPNYDLMCTVDHTFSYRSQKFKHACTKSSVYGHGTKSRDGKLFKTVMDGSVLTRKVAYRSQTAIQGQPGMFHQMRVTAGDTACNLSGVLHIKYICI